MRKIFLLVLLFLPSIIQAKNELNFLTWADYVKPEVIKQFEQETGIKVNADFVDSHYALEAKIIAVNNNYDVTIPTLAPFFMRQVQFGLFIPLDYSKFTNYRYIDPKVIAFEKNADNSDIYAVPFMVDSIGIGYDYNKIAKLMPNAPFDSLELIFNPDIIKNFSSCGIEFLDSSEEIFALALIYLGLDPNSETHEDLEKAAQLLYKIRPYINNINSSLYFNNLGSGDNCLVVGYSGDIVHAQKLATQANNNADIRYILPKEGSVMTLDLMAIPVTAPNKENAYKFIDFLMRADVNAKIANSIGFTSPNTASYSLINKSLRDNPNIYPIQHKKDNFVTLKIPSSQFNRLRNRVWMKFLSGEED